ncbi:ornithine cyclodeaminase family protein [Kutzneria kofuensis]|uniref:Ornithine cyclodeaminase n=1 Tax=Kutzneria kofuensis TaxID=103725 RepID=A0A7W9KI14_9PSEU|nr:ornithine cyclodeaminase family protein [Kutzneria kofuensis]MBB5892993.1 ornithine cyclodeaminase [Kutzneria kofuensis]
MLTVDAARIGELLSFDVLVPTLRNAFAHGQRATVAPQRHRHRVDNELDATMLIGASWTRNYLGVKVSTVFPRNVLADLESYSSTYLLSHGRTGHPLAVLDGGELTRRATAGVSALAASYLARPDTRTLLVIGEDRYARAAAQAYQAVFELDRLLVLGETPGFVCDGVMVAAVTDLEAALTAADAVVCATVATSKPVLPGAWVKPGTFVHLAGSFTPYTREGDNDLIADASVFLDTSTALTESGDLAQPAAAGIAPKIRGTLFDLCAGAVLGRQDEGEITLLKSVGTAIADLATAAVVHTSVPSG